MEKIRDEDGQELEVVEGAPDYEGPQHVQGRQDEVDA